MRRSAQTWVTLGLLAFASLLLLLAYSSGCSKGISPTPIPTTSSTTSSTSSSSSSTTTSLSPTTSRATTTATTTSTTVTTAGSGWELKRPAPTSTSDQISAIIVNNNDIVAAGQRTDSPSSQRGLILFSNNAGSNWSEMEQGNPGDNFGITQLQGFASGTVYASATGSGGANMYRSQNNGQTWQSYNLSGSSMGSINAFYGLSEDQLWVSSGMGVFYTFEASSRPTTFALYPLPITANTYLPSGLQFFNDGGIGGGDVDGNIIINYGPTGESFYSADHGQTWTSKLLNSIYNFKGIGYADANSLMVAGTRRGGGSVPNTGIIETSIDRGMTWTPQPIVNFYISALYVVPSSTEVWIAGDNNIARSMNFGLTWQTWTFSNSISFSCVYANGGKAWAGTYDGAIYHYGN